MERLGSMDIRPAKRETYRQPKTPSARLIPLLLTLATARQADFGPKAQETYARGLDGFLLEDMQAAVTALCLQERPEGRSSMPSLGEMVTAFQAASRRRHEAASLAKQAQESQYVREHPDRFCSWKELLGDMQMMQDAVEVAFGPMWRSHPLMQEKDMQGKHRFGLADMFDLAVRP